MILTSFLAAALLTLPVDPSATAVPDSMPAGPATAVAPAAPDSGRILRLRDVVITATRTPLALAAAPASVSVIVPDPLMPGSSVSATLSSVSGASFGATGGQGSSSSLFLRGAAGEGVLVLQDGMPLNSPLLGGYDLNKISGNADRIEIVRGPASSLYGANAVGGVINITTAPAPGDRPYSRVTYLKGGYGTQQLAAKFSRSLAAGLSMWLGADWNSTGGQRVNSSYDGTNYTVGATTGPFWGVTAAARFQDYAAEAGVPGPLWHGTPYAKQRDKQQDLSLRLSRAADSGTCLAGGSLAVCRSAARNAFENDGVVTDNDSRTLTIDGQYSFALPAAMTLTAGGAYQRTECQSDNSGEHGLRQRALFANAQYRPIGALLLIPGPVLAGSIGQLSARSARRLDAGALCRLGPGVPRSHGQRAVLAR
ncbi:MAG: TonB-dependent receptor plug domain-containing protein [Candidatus Edwardsbacteria bacterium]|nr:TonB-dependent receptor plug domain-containing protein [Candidatus Edwardsbacteria bacterium]